MLSFRFQVGRAVARFVFVFFAFFGDGQGHTYRKTQMGNALTNSAWQARRRSNDFPEKERDVPVTA